MNYMPITDVERTHMLGVIGVTSPTSYLPTFPPRFATAS